METQIIFNWLIIAFSVVGSINFWFILSFIKNQNEINRKNLELLQMQQDALEILGDKVFKE